METFDLSDPGHNAIKPPRRLKAANFKPLQNADEESEIIAVLNITFGPQYGRRFLVTEEGYIGLAPNIAQKGDIVCVLLGGEVPFVLRPLKDGYYKLIGEWCVSYDIPPI
jgi:hypothetical protein